MRRLLQPKRSLPQLPARLEQLLYVRRRSRRRLRVYHSKSRPSGQGVHDLPEKTLHVLPKRSRLGLLTSITYFHWSNVRLKLTRLLVEHAQINYVDGLNVADLVQRERARLVFGGTRYYLSDVVRRATRLKPLGR